jgi:diphthamide synthase (EF-2-diphthine--ammonia ligase)
MHVPRLDSKLICAQSQAIEIPLIQRKVTWDTYEREFKKAIGELKQIGVKGVVFEDVTIQEHKD